MDNKEKIIKKVLSEMKLFRSKLRNLTINNESIKMNSIIAISLDKENKLEVISSFNGNKDSLLSTIDWILEELVQITGESKEEILLQMLILSNKSKKEYDINNNNNLNEIHLPKPKEELEYMEIKEWYLNSWKKRKDGFVGNT